MRAHLVQMDIVWESPEANYRKVDEMLGGCSVQPGDLVVLPEMFDTGFSLRTEVTADRNGKTLGFVRGLAQRLGATVQGGLTRAGAGTDDKATNRAVVFDPGGAQIADYAKVHPFGFGREPERFVGGDDIVIYPWAGDEGRTTVAPSICYDLRFPELFRRQTVLGAEVLALGANWPDARQAHWRALAIARAIENLAFMLAVNRAGSDPHLSYAGGTIAVGPKGEVLGELGAEEGVLSVTLDLPGLREWRAQFGALGDIRVLDMPAG